MYTEVYTILSRIHFYTLPLVGVYTSPGRWGAHYTTTLPYTTPQEKKLACMLLVTLICIHFSIIYTSPASLMVNDE